MQNASACATSREEIFHRVPKLNFGGVVLSSTLRRSEASISTRCIPPYVNFVRWPDDAYIAATTEEEQGGPDIGINNKIILYCAQR